MHTKLQNSHRVAPSQDDAQVLNFYTPPRHGGLRRIYPEVLQAELTGNSPLHIAWVGMAKGGAIATNRSYMCNAL